MMKDCIIHTAAFVGISCISIAQAQETAKSPSTRTPNVVVLMTDDLGYGDAGCYGAKPEHVKTPNIDKLAAEGIRFTDGHSASSVCSPSRASMLTGDYAWRHPKGSGILSGVDPLFLKPGSYSMPAMFKEKGYTTGVIGKWHLGLGDNGNPDWNGLVTPGPNEIGFDYSFLLPATGDRTPTVYLRNGRVVNLDPKDPITVSFKGRIADEPTGIHTPELATVLLGKKNEGHLDGITAGVSRIGWMTGGKDALWDDRTISDTLVAETEQFLEKNKEKPFFLYLATHGIHEPRLPHQRFVGKSGCGIYGDQIMELDDLTGRVMEQLKKLNLDENTLIVFTADNGGSIEGGNGRYIYGKAADRGTHAINGVLRGAKGTVYEGGTRVPFIVRWPAKVPAGKTSSALISQTDLAASFAALLDYKLPDNAARDSENLLPALLGKSENGREELLEHLLGGTRGVALREGNWKLKGGELYDLSTDLSERHNLAAKHPERVKAMQAKLDKIVHSKQTR